MHILILLYSLGQRLSCALRQGGEQQQGVVRAVQLECGCMQHECSRQAEAIQLLEAAADKRRMQERQQEHHFWDISREALGKSWTATGHYIGVAPCQSCP